ncbi:unnamed protein product [Lactuca saligna]|uniref:Uncharacterized protein n=1 Tax=Lactuca saligna TaxID=75948 RepID=A0AA35ZMR3_LACSI|nr:unnamed protein product [Lactuca saligna]
MRLDAIDALLHSHQLTQTLSNFHNISDLSFLSQRIRIDLFLINSNAWRVTRKILKLVVATGKEEILSIFKHIIISFPLDARKTFIRSATV